MPPESDDVHFLPALTNVSAQNAPAPGLQVLDSLLLPQATQLDSVHLSLPPSKDPGEKGGEAWALKGVIGPAKKWWPGVTPQVGESVPGRWLGQ